MKCTSCRGTGLFSPERLCPVCDGSPDLPEVEETKVESHEEVIAPVEEAVESPEVAGAQEEVTEEQQF